MMNVLSNDAETLLWQAVGCGFARLFQGAAGFDLVKVPGGMLAMTGAAAPDLNCGAVWASPDAAAATRALAAALGRRGLPGILLVADSAGADAHSAAAEVGLIAAARMPLMTLLPGPIGVDVGFTTRQATSPSDLLASNRVTAAAFDLPVALLDEVFGAGLLDAGDVTVELVLDGDEPVGSLQTTSFGTLVGVWSMATPPAQRRRGIARAGLSHVLSRRFRTGASQAFLVATDAGRPLYDAVGFEVVGWCTAWVGSSAGGSG